MKQIKESILSSTGTGKLMLIRKWLEETFGFKPNREELSYSLDGGKVQIFGDVYDINFNDIEIPDYVHIDYFQPTAMAGKKIWLYISGNDAYKKFIKAFADTNQLGEENFKVSLRIKNITTKISTDDFINKKIFGDVYFDKCSELLFSKGLPNAENVIIESSCKDVILPAGIGRLLKTLQIK